ncbi:MAG: ribosome biogenesis GTPase Der [Eubacteriales bacterium]|nr:ribosome biogenesis GTPase Der [Eubacteriales bacterium]
MKSLPIVAIVGRPNVGKSTFFNAIIGRRISIVKDTPGVTRDRIYADSTWNGKSFTLIDTGGIDTLSDDVLLSQMRTQAQLAIDTADVILLFVDARDGLLNQDMEIANMLRLANKPIIPVVNKADHQELAQNAYEYYALGLGDPIAISSTNLLGLGDLLDEIVKRFPEDSDTQQDQNAIQVAIVGRPNVGKSSLVNKLLNENRVMVSNIPGTTRDAIDSLFVHENGTAYNIIDTAGIRKKRAIEDESIERYSVIRSLSAIRRADVVVLMIDAQDGVTQQDTKIAGIAKNEGKASIIVINKWDAIEKETGTFEKFRLEVLEKLNFISYSPTLFISALTGQRTHMLFETIDKVYAQAGKLIPTGLLNDCIGEAQLNLQTPLIGGRRLRIYYATQTGSFPPSFLMFVNDETLLHFSYERYLENQLRKSFGFEGTPIRFSLKERKEEDE